MFSPSLVLFLCMVSVDIAGRLPSRYGRAKAERVIRTAYGLGGGTDRVRVSLSIVDDKTMRRLNRRYRHKDRTTDVLSFPFDDAGFVDGSAAAVARTLGEIVVSLPQVRRQAAAIDRTVTEEFSLMLAHGTLHLMGYDHEKIEDERVMFGLQHETLLRTGVL